MTPKQQSRITKFAPPRVWPSNSYKMRTSRNVEPPATTRRDTYSTSPAAQKTAFLQAKIDAERNKNT